MDYMIKTNFTGPNFVQVPNIVAQSTDISPEALGVLVYMASLPSGFVLRVSTVLERFGIGKDKWQRIARELRDTGCMELEIVRGSGGRAVGRKMLVQWPQLDASQKPAPTESRKSPLSVTRSDRKPDLPKAGKPAKHGGQTRQTRRANPAPYKDKQKQIEPAALNLDFEVKNLSAFQRSALLSGKPCLVGGALVPPSSPEAASLCAALRGSGNA